LKSVIAPLVAEIKQQPNPTTKTHESTIHTTPPNKVSKTTILTNLYISLPSSDSQRKESQVVSPVLLLLRQTIVFREGL